MLLPEIDYVFTNAVYVIAPDSIFDFTPTPPSLQTGPMSSRRVRTEPPIWATILIPERPFSANVWPRKCIRIAPGSVPAGRRPIPESAKRNNAFFNTSTAKCIELSEVGAVEWAISRCDQRKPLWAVTLIPERPFSANVWPRKCIRIAPGFLLFSGRSLPDLQGAVLKSVNPLTGHQLPPNTVSSKGCPPSGPFTMNASVAFICARGS